MDRFMSGQSNEIFEKHSEEVEGPSLNSIEEKFSRTRLRTIEEAPKNLVVQDKSNALSELMDYMQGLFPKIDLLLKTQVPSDEKVETASIPTFPEIGSTEAISVPEMEIIKAMRAKAQEFLDQAMRLNKKTQGILNGLPDARQTSSIELFQQPSKHGEFDKPILQNNKTKLEKGPFLEKEVYVPENTEVERSQEKMNEYPDEGNINCKETSTAIIAPSGKDGLPLSQREDYHIDGNPGNPGGSGELRMIANGVKGGLGEDSLGELEKLEKNIMGEIDQNKPKAEIKKPEQSITLESQPLMGNRGLSGNPGDVNITNGINNQLRTITENAGENGENGNPRQKIDRSGVIHVLKDSSKKKKSGFLNSCGDDDSRPNSRNVKSNKKDSRSKPKI